MSRRRIRSLFVALAVAAALGGRAQAQANLADELLDKFNALLPLNSSQPMSVGELCHRLDCLADELRKDGQVVIKQPDVFSQARMTRFRYDFETQMSADLANFYLVLAARVNRLDAATTTSTSALGAALAAPGTTNVTAPTASATQVLGTPNNLFTGGPTMTGTSNVLAQGAFGGLGVAPQPTQSTAATAAMGLGVDPTVYLDEKKRFLDHLNEIRRINLGPDQNDSSGYGLYLVRFPVSITPGECTREGHGADLAITVEHEFTPDFLPDAFRDLVINDVVGQLGPLVYEVIRSRYYEEVLKPRCEARARACGERASGRSPQLSRGSAADGETAGHKPDSSGLNVNLPSALTPRRYPIAPRELIDYFLEDCVFLLCRDAKNASRTQIIRSNEVCDNMRHALRAAYHAMFYDTQGAAGWTPPLTDDAFMGELLEAIHERSFSCLGGRGKRPSPGTRGLSELYEALVERLALARHNIRGEPISALCWAVAVDAVLLDEEFRTDIRKVFKASGLSSDAVDEAHFYYPRYIPNDVGKDLFREYVKRRWPILTFALAPVVAEQNIADSFNLKRDLQLALSFAFSTGQINFSQLDTFRRKIEQSADTIALNRTVTAFAHGDNNFEFRFTPRFQNPPMQRTNLAVIASQFISGGPGPDYAIRKSKLEPGIHELTAVVLAPTFLPVMRMNVSSNWFRLTDPHHPVFHTARMMERGRRARDLRSAAAVLWNADRYREADRRVLESKLQRLEEMLPLQSRVVQLPYENSASGFDLFSDGVTALVPMLTGYSGVDVITAPGTPAGAAATGSATTPTGSSTTTATPAAAPSPAPPTFSVTTLTSAPNPTTTYALVGGATTIADVFVFGKSISLLDSRVIAGGRVASFEILSREVIHVQIPANVIPTTTEDGKTYLEIYVATPNGISNSILVPYLTSPAPPTLAVAYDVAPASQSMDLYYQWMLVGGKQTLVATADPGKGGITISWNSSTGLAPRQIQAQFAAAANGRNVIVGLAAEAGATGDYTFDARTFVVSVLDRLTPMTVFPALPPSPLVFTVQVLPFQPNAMEGLRSETTPKPLASTITVNLQYNATGKNALLGVQAAAAWREEAPAALDDPRITARSARDPALTRTARQAQSTTASQNAPQPPPPPYRPPLLAPNVSSEAEQVARLLTGQPLAAAVAIPPAAQLVQAQAAAAAAAQAANAAIAQAAQARTPSIVVNPSPVVVVSPPPTKAKPHHHASRLHQMLNRIENRMSAAVPPP